MNRKLIALFLVVLVMLAACGEEDEDELKTKKGSDGDAGLQSVGDELQPDGPGLVGESDAAAPETSLPTPEPLELGRDLPTPTNTPEPTVTSTPKSFMPADGTHQMTATFSNGTGGCGQASEFTGIYEVTISDEEITMLLLVDGFTYSGTINPDATFLVIDDGGFPEIFEGKVNPDGSIEAINTLTVDDCTTTWVALFTQNE